MSTTSKSKTFMAKGINSRPQAQLQEIQAWTYRLPQDEPKAPLRLIISLQRHYGVLSAHDVVALATTDGTSDPPAVPADAPTPLEVPDISMDNLTRPLDASSLAEVVENVTALTPGSGSSRKKRYYPRRFVRRVDRIVRRAVRRGRKEISPKVTPRILALLLGREQASIVQKILGET